MTVEHRSVAAADRVKVGVAELAVATGDTLVTTSGLGSCVGIAVADPPAKVAGLAHVMLPVESGTEPPTKPAKSVPTGVAGLLDAVEEAGGHPARFEAKLAGGSQMLDFSGVGEAVGERNVDRTHEALEDGDVPIVAEDVGGSHGRSLVLNPSAWTLTVTSAHEGVVEL